MANFKQAYDKTMKVEGGYSNHPKDTGGETWKGIARNKNPTWPGWRIVDRLRDQRDFLRKLEDNPELQAHVLEKYKADYWDEIRLDKVDDQSVAEELFDTAVNMGTGRAKLFFQRVLNVCRVNSKGVKLFADLTVDGNVGPKTIAAFNLLSVSQKGMVWKLLNCLQGARYVDICESNPNQEIFMTSWASRVFEQ